MSVVVNTEHDERALERCLQSTAWADEVVVLDAGRGNETAAVARRYTDKVYSRPKFGRAESARNLAISHTTGEWVFVLDDDELIPERLAAGVRKIIAESEGYALVAIPRRNYIGEYAVKNSGWGADYQPRLFKRDRVTWTGVTNCWPRVDGEVRYLEPDGGYYIKRSYCEDLSDLVDRLNRQASVEAASFPAYAEWPNWRGVLLEVFEEFRKHYTPKEDGFQSLALAGSMAFQRFLTHCKRLGRIREAEGDIVFPLPESLEEIAAEALRHLPARICKAQGVNGKSETLGGLRESEEGLSLTRSAHEARLNDLTAELTNARASHEVQSAAYEAQLAAQAARLADYEAQIDRLTGELFSARAETSLHVGRLAEKDEELQRLRREYDEQFARQENELAERVSHAEQQASMLLKLKASADKKDEVLRWIQTSRSWRTASLLRRMSGLKSQWRQYGVTLGRNMRLPMRPTFYGLIESPTEAANVAGELEIRGWAFSTAAGVTLVEAFLDHFYLGQLRYGSRRPDVMAAYPTQGRIECGYSERVVLDPSMTGHRKLLVRVHDTQGNMQVYTRHVVVGPHTIAKLPVASISTNGNGRRPAAVAAAETPFTADDAGPNFYSQLSTLVSEFKSRTGREPSILNWNTGLSLAAALPELAVFSPPSANGHPGLPYFDRSADIVVIPAGNSRQLAEAQRVAVAAVVQAHGTEMGPDQMSSDPDADTPHIRLVTEWMDEALGEAASPEVSIIIPVFNKVAYTEKCLKQVLATLPDNFRGEIVVVDDASADETPSALDRWASADERVRVLRNERNQGFIMSCNRGAEVARGEVLVFLNNDTVPQPGWLPPLLRVLRERPDAGAVGGKLLYPDGTLQEAGCVIFSDGTGWNFGKRDTSPNAPLYNFLREVDYCSGALLATPRELFLSLGGFDTRFAPAYYEDTDYCFSLRAVGRKVYYQPESVIIHYEGVSSGTHVKSGVKRYQVVNLAKFREKWDDVLGKYPAPRHQYDFNTLHALSVREEV